MQAATAAVTSLAKRLSLRAARMQLEDTSKKESIEAGRQATWPSEGMEAYWKWLIETDHKASQAYDKAVMTLSGGALAVSLAFIKDIIKSPTPNSLLALEFAWGCLAFSIVAILFSMLSSQWALRRAMKQVEQQTIHKCRPGGWLSKLTAVLNVLAGLGFIAGVILLAIFSITNMKSASNAPFL